MTSNDKELFCEIPACAWQRPIGLGWEKPYTVRYSSNLDDGPWHGSPLGGFGAGCIGRSSRGDFNLWHLDGGEHVFGNIPACQFSVFEQVAEETTQAYALCTEPPEDGTLSAWSWYPASQGSGGAGEQGSGGGGGGAAGGGRRCGGAGVQLSAGRGTWEREREKARGRGNRERERRSTFPNTNTNTFPQSPVTSRRGGVTPPVPVPSPQSPVTNTGTYHALYPRSWFVYDGVFQTQLTCEQFSPVWAGNYQESSYPIAIFEWTAHNPTDKPITISIMLTWQNIIGWFTNSLKTKEVRIRDDGSPVYDYQPRLGNSTGNFNQWIEEQYRVGCLLDRVRLDDNDVREEEGQWAIATLSNPTLEIFHHTRWNPAGDGSDIWQTFSVDGSLPDRENETPADPGEQIGVAMAIRFTLRPGKTKKIPFILAWDFPVTEFADNVTYYRRYTDFFGRNGKNSWSMIRTALKHYDTWKERIQAWQEPILNRDDLPNWFKMALFNELYDLTSGGTLWSAADERDPVGQFAILECIDYRWYESLDVRLYGSFPVAMLWPKLDKAVLEAYARAIPTRDDTRRIIGYNRESALRKIADATPHDLGAPNEHPWEKTNYTSYQDCNLWKDLPCDFVLQVYRHFVFTGGKDVEFLQECWSSIVKTLAYLKTFDKDGDGIPENTGAPDQTFDDWRLQGVSAYCGGLWLAALQAAIAIGDILADSEQESCNYTETIDSYKNWLQSSQIVYQEKLWNGQYYRLDSESNSDVVMTDQLCGQFYSRLLGLPDIVPVECAESTLKTVYDACFIKFNNYLQTSKQFKLSTTDIQNPTNSPNDPTLCSQNPTTSFIGAANGVKLDGNPENPNATHPLEVWTGINFGVAAFMLQLGMKAEAFEIAQAVVQQIYENGLQFRTPEAITTAGTFRASYYLRGMTIWAIYFVLTNFLS